uniref:Butyrophilin subfamily 3 member A2-like Ig-C domain-containing protein n=1 Tax=Gasterosteus aculeatus aculeatus TaxID=481459 RepID=G3Q4M7_GASAC
MRCCYLFDSGASTVKILAVVGQTVILPCRKQVREENVLHVEWKKDNDTAFVYKDGCEAFGDKSDAFLYRTQLILQELKDGNMSLRLSDVRAVRCRDLDVQQEPDPGRLHGAASEPTLDVVPGKGVTLQCEAACWVPKPDVTFLDAQGNIIDAEASKYHQDTRSRCYNVTRRATVQAGNYFTCRVNQSEINQTKTVKIHVPDNCTIPRTVAIIAAVIMFLIGIGIVYQWRNSGESITLFLFIKRVCFHLQIRKFIQICVEMCSFYII